VTADANYGDACPPATQDIVLNIENRQNAIDKVGYGPLNPVEPNEVFWQEKADRWSIESVEAKKSICGNCVFFDRRPKTLDCIESGIAEGGSGEQSAWDAIDQAELGYCTSLDFKCAASRTCNAWAAGGPITEDSDKIMDTTTTQIDDVPVVAAGDLEKNENDPCWDGYVQVGMKEKGGNRVPNCVPAASTLDYIVASANEEYGVARQLTPETAYEVARKACSKYEYISDEELYSAVLWDVMSFVEYATTGVTEDEEEMAEYAGLLPEGHPATESSLVASLLWVASAPELDNSGRQVVLKAFSDDSDYVDSLHASTRLKVLLSSGTLSETTAAQLKATVKRYHQVD
jgi:hypothetical protein